MTVTKSMSLSDSTMTSAVKESIVTSKTTVLFSLAISAETPQLNQIPLSSTLGKARDTHEPLPTTTMAVTNISSPTTVALGTTVLSTATAETQEKDTAAVPPTPVTTPTTSEPPDPQRSSVTQTPPSHSAQTTSDAGMTLDTTPSPPKSTGTGTGSSVSPSSGDTHRTMTTSSIPTAPEKSSLTPPSLMLVKAGDTHEPLPTTTMAVTNTSLPTIASLRTTVLSTATAETQDKDTATVPPTPATTPTTSKPPDPHSSVTQTPSQPAQTDSSIGTGTVQSPGHPTGLVHNGSETTKSSTIIGTSPAPPSSSQSSGPGGGACALDEYLDSTRGCMCNKSYYSHLELSREMGTLRCKPEVIEVALRSCFLKHQHWVLKKDVFSGCSSTNTTDQGHRVQVFQLEKKKEGTCGLHISVLGFPLGANIICPVGDWLLQDLNNGASIQVTPAFTLSRFLNNDTLYLHAQVTLCDKQASRPCQLSCSGKNSLRRNSPWDSRVGTRLEPGGSKWIVFGPLRISESSSSRSRAGAWMSILLLMVTGWMLD
ncbi:LOW QUALITY PROTEIN: uncharacterized protein LOC142833334 [Microtus pennsylvanicus]|uniref:LOW QUALITY PROTEIN: uncharacterized protein LOC142833334 n=1 Tax=Microtus pennsylvanicus TaxID=10058 RepID=UPI003F6C8641